MSRNVQLLSLFRNDLYRNCFPEIPALAESNYFLQFNGYEIFLPGEPDSANVLNIFELSVLRLQSIGNFTVEELGEKLCLRAEKSSGGYDYDLVKFICRRLNELGFLDDANHITESGRAFLGDSVSSASSLKLYILLVTRDSQEIFPVIFKAEELIKGECEKSEVSITLGSTGRARELKGHCIFVKEKGRRDAFIAQNKILSALKKLNRRLPRKIRIAENFHIESTYHGEVFLHVKAVLQNGNVDYLVVSEGLSSHSDFLSKYLARQDSTILSRLKENAQQIQSRRAGDENYVDRGKYPEIRAAMKKQEISAEDVDSRENAEAAQKKLVENLLKAVEWALQYHLKKIPPPENLTASLAIQSPEENELMLLEFAKRLGIDTARHGNFFKNVASAPVKNALTTENPALNPLLPLNIAAARNPDSNLLAALKYLPLDAIERLSRYGKSLRHDNSWEPQENDTADSLYDSVLKFVTALLPDYANPDALKSDEVSASMQKINAQFSLFEKLGEEVYQDLPPDVQELLLKISPDKDGSQMLRAVDFVEVLSSVLEKILREKILDAPEKIAVPKTEVLARLKKFGQAAELGTVGDFYYRKACEKENATLGAYALAYFALLDDDALKDCTARNLPAFISEIAGYRGHGTNLNLLIETGRLAALREKVFEILKNRG